VSRPALRTLPLPSGEPVPVLGQGTWGWAEDPRRRPDELAALRLGLDLGMTLVDTAEMYADGAAEELVAEGIAGRRNEVFLVDKVLPSNATRQGTVKACRRSLDRLRTDRIDLYLLHWRGRVPLADTVEAFEELVQGGQIRYWGVSNFDVDDLADLSAVPGGTAVVTDQILYNLQRRGPEYDLLPLCRDRGLPVMAYSPVEQGRLLDHPVLAEVARRHGITPARVALAWVLRSGGVVAIPRAGSTAHVRDNAAALDVRLEPSDLELLDEAFPPPRRRQPLEVL
jgi:diketogulonate reductase-like aldo/keto reductase